MYSCRKENEQVILMTCARLNMGQIISGHMFQSAIDGINSAELSLIPQYFVRSPLNPITHNRFASTEKEENSRSIFGTKSFEEN